MYYMQEIYRDSTCIIYTKNKSGLYTDIYGNHIRISSLKARYISNQLQRNNYNVLNMLHAQITRTNRLGKGKYRYNCRYYSND